jgi:S1-C subfamily serine protease
MRRLFGALAVVAALLFGVLYGRRSAPKAGPTAKQVASTVQTAIDKAAADAAKAPTPSTIAYRAILPSLVVVQVKLKGQALGEDDEVGAAVIINVSGQMITANHVIERAASIRVIFADGTRSAVTVVSSDPQKDVAVLAADTLPETVVPAVMGGGVGVGDDVFAVGHPFGLEGSLTAGVVSGLERSATAKNGRPLSGLIQFDAAVNPGSSGGPLLNRRGQVVGIVTASATLTEQPLLVGIGFAIPITTAGGAAGGPTL